jgi:hypothetical protein
MTSSSSVASVDSTKQFNLLPFSISNILSNHKSIKSENVYDENDDEISSLMNKKNKSVKKSKEIGSHSTSPCFNKEKKAEAEDENDDHDDDDDDQDLNTYEYDDQEEEKTEDEDTEENNNVDEEEEEEYSENDGSIERYLDFIFIFGLNIYKYFKEMKAKR